MFTPDCLKAFPQVTPRYGKVTFNRELATRTKKCELLGIGHPLVDALLAYLQNAPFHGEASCIPAAGEPIGIVEARYRVTWDRADQGASATIVSVKLNGQNLAEEASRDAQRLPIQRAPKTSNTITEQIALRSEEAIRLWVASRRTEFPPETIPRVELLGVSVTGE